MSSTREAFADRPATLAEYLAVLRRRKWIVLLLPIVAAVTAYSLSAQEAPVYRANAEVLFQLSNIPTQIANLPGFLSDPNYMATQANIASSSELAERVVGKAGLSGETPGLNATARTDANILDLSVTSSTPTRATRLVNVYAKEFMSYKAQLYMSPIRAQLRTYDRRMDSLRANGQRDSTTYQDLQEKKFELESLGRQLANNSTVLHYAGGAGQISPRPRRNAILGGLLGLVLGIGLAFLADALDKRVRTEREVEDTLGVPLLGRVPRPSRRLEKANGLVMLEEPTSVHAQTFRRLRTSLEFVNFEHGAQRIMVTSAMPREGKSTTVANLAVALARAGRRVTIADLDLRRPFLHTFFATGSDHGFTDVVVNRTKLERAVRPIALPGPSRMSATQSTNGSTPAASNGQGNVESVVYVLPSGTIPPAADEFLERERVATVLDDLSSQSDVVLLDAPPLLAVGDVISLSTKVDAIVVVVRLGIHRRQLEELARQLQTCRALVLGFVLTGASHGDSYSYGYGYDQRVYEDVHQEDETLSERS